MYMDQSLYLNIVSNYSQKILPFLLGVLLVSCSKMPEQTDQISRIVYEYVNDTDYSCLICWKDPLHPELQAQTVSIDSKASFSQEKVVEFLNPVLATDGRPFLVNGTDILVKFGNSVEYSSDLRNSPYGFWYGLPHSEFLSYEKEGRNYNLNRYYLSDIFDLALNQ